MRYFLFVYFFFFLCHKSVLSSPSFCSSLKGDGMLHSSVQSLSHVWLCDLMNCSTLGLPVHHQLPEFTQTHIHQTGDAIQPSHPLSSSFPPTFNLPSIRVFSNESALHIRWLKYLSFSFNISPSNEHPGLISFSPGVVDPTSRLVGSPCCPRDSQESPSTPQFKTINSSVLSFLYSPNSHVHTWPLEKP